MDEMESEASEAFLANVFDAHRSLEDARSPRGVHIGVLEYVLRDWRREPLSKDLGGLQRLCV